MLTFIVLVLVAVIATILLLASLRPSEYTIAREITIDKPAEPIFDYLQNPKRMELWAPWKTLDPHLIMSYSGPNAGVGAKASWDSPGKMGAGSATVVGIVPNKTVRTKLEYKRPFTMNQDAEISIVQSGSQSVVKWSVQGHNGFMQRVVFLFMNMDKMVGGNFESGLSNLKSLLEKSK